MLHELSVLATRTAPRHPLACGRFWHPFLPYSSLNNQKKKQQKKSQTFRDHVSYWSHRNRRWVLGSGPAARLWVWCWSLTSGAKVWDWSLKLRSDAEVWKWSLKPRSAVSEHWACENLLDKNLDLRTLKRTLRRTFNHSVGGILERFALRANLVTDFQFTLGRMIEGVPRDCVNGRLQATWRQETLLLKVCSSLLY